MMKNEPQNEFFTSEKQVKVLAFSKSLMVFISKLSYVG